MPVRKQSLEEWFLCHQLGAIRRNHFHLPFSLEADVSAVARVYSDRNEKVPYTALLIKALAMTAVKVPEINRMVFSTPFGKRVVDFDFNRVNVPVVVEKDGKRHLAVMTVEDAHLLSLSEIRDRLRAAKSIDVGKLRIGKLVVGKKNNLFNRCRLRLLHRLTFAFPSLYVRFGGGLAVSSLLPLREEGLDLLLHSYGPTAFTLCSSTVISDAAGKQRLRIGIGIDHYALSGEEMVRASAELNRVLAALTD